MADSVTESVAPDPASARVDVEAPPSVEIDVAASPPSAAGPPRSNPEDAVAEALAPAIDRARIGARVSEISGRWLPHERSCVCHHTGRVLAREEAVEVAGAIEFDLEGAPGPFERVWRRLRWRGRPAEADAHSVTASGAAPHLGPGIHHPRYAHHTDWPVWPGALAIGGLTAAITGARLAQDPSIELAVRAVAAAAGPPLAIVSLAGLGIWAIAGMAAVAADRRHRHGWTLAPETVQVQVRDSVRSHIELPLDPAHRPAVAVDRTFRVRTRPGPRDACSGPLPATRRAWDFGWIMIDVAADVGRGEGGHLLPLRQGQAQPLRLVDDGRDSRPDPTAFDGQRWLVIEEQSRGPLRRLPIPVAPSARALVAGEPCVERLDPLDPPVGRHGSSLGDGIPETRVLVRAASDSVSALEIVVSVVLEPGPEPTRIDFELDLELTPVAGAAVPRMIDVGSDGRLATGGGSVRWERCDGTAAREQVFRVWFDRPLTVVFDGAPVAQGVQAVARAPRFGLRGSTRVTVHGRSIGGFLEGDEDVSVYLPDGRPRYAGPKHTAGGRPRQEVTRETRIETQIAIDSAEIDAAVPIEVWLRPGPYDVPLGGLRVIDGVERIADRIGTIAGVRVLAIEELRGREDGTAATDGGRSWIVRAVCILGERDHGVDAPLSPVRIEMRMTPEASGGPGAPATAVRVTGEVRGSVATIGDAKSVQVIARDVEKAI